MNHYEPITMEDVSDADTLLYIIRLGLGMLTLCVIGIGILLGFL